MVDLLIILIFVIIAHVYVYQIITLYSLKVYNYICQLFLNEFGGGGKTYVSSLFGSWSLLIINLFAPGVYKFMF